MPFVSKNKLDELFNDGYRAGYENAANDCERDVNDLEIKIGKLEGKLAKDNAELEILREQRQAARDTAAKEIELSDKEVLMQKTVELQDAREARLDERASKLDGEEEANYKKGYADGVSDGLRKIHEITKEDRENLAKIAMVSAASHTSIENLKEVNSEFRLTEGSTDKKAK